MFKIFFSNPLQQNLQEYCTQAQRRIYGEPRALHHVHVFSHTCVPALSRF